MWYLSSQGHTFTLGLPHAAASPRGDAVLCVPYAALCGAVRSWWQLAKVQGDFVWHSHDITDELFMVTQGAARWHGVGMGRAPVACNGVYRGCCTARNPEPPHLSQRQARCTLT